MFGQFLVEPEEDERVEPEELEVDPVPDDEFVPLVLLVPVDPVLAVLVAALAASAPPVTRPAVSAPKVTA
jgi:hypothetical protein